jgi:REP element-mobilizing transposase RayT
MPRAARVAPGGMVFHVLNRGVGRMELFSKEKDYAAFEDLLEQTRESRPMRICAYCLMPNHWHFVLWPEHEGDLAAFMQQLSTKHVRRWQLHRRRVGSPDGRTTRTGINPSRTEPPKKGCRESMTRKISAPVPIPPSPSFNSLTPLQAAQKPICGRLFFGRKIRVEVGHRLW